MEEMLSRAVEQILGRASGPLHFRLIIQPVVAILLAVRAGRRDGRDGHPPFLWGVLTRPDDRRRLLRSAWKDIGKIFLVAMTLDTIYQVIVLKGFYPVQTVLVAVVLAIVPYAIVRGPVARLWRRRDARP